MRRELNKRLRAMSNDREGIFSANFLSLQLQLKTLLEGVGGESTVQFLDLLGALNPSEQQLALKAFSGVLDRIRGGEQRLFTSEDRALKDFEDSLYRDILGSMRDAANNNSPRRIEVIDGGKSIPPPVSKTPIDFNEAKRNRKLKGKPLLN